MNEKINDVSDLDAERFSVNEVSNMLDQIALYTCYGDTALDTDPGSLLWSWFIRQDNKSDIPRILPEVPQEYTASMHTLEEYEDLASKCCDRLAHIDRLIAHLNVNRLDIARMLKRAYYWVGVEQEKLAAE
jgi:hypothetical protein